MATTWDGGRTTWDSGRTTWDDRAVAVVYGSRGGTTRPEALGSSRPAQISSADRRNIQTSKR